MVPLFLETKQLPISFYLFEQVSLLMHGVHNNLARSNIKNMFKLRNCLLSIVTGLDLLLTRIIMLSKQELKTRKEPSLSQVP